MERKYIAMRLQNGGQTYGQLLSEVATSLKDVTQEVQTEMDRVRAKEQTITMAVAEQVGTLCATICATMRGLPTTWWFRTSVGV